MHVGLKGIDEKTRNLATDSEYQWPGGPESCLQSHYCGVSEGISLFGSGTERRSSVDTHLFRHPKSQQKNLTWKVSFLSLSHVPHPVNPRRQSPKLSSSLRWGDRFRHRSWTPPLHPFVKWFYGSMDDRVYSDFIQTKIQSFCTRGSRTRHISYSPWVRVTPRQVINREVWPRVR